MIAVVFVISECVASQSMIFADDTADEILECGGFYCTTTSEGDLIVTGLA